VPTSGTHPRSTGVRLSCSGEVHTVIIMFLKTVKYNSREEILIEFMLGNLKGAELQDNIKM
jgi:hypothetical protein